MTTEQPIIFSFRGQRDYITGATIFDKLLPMDPDPREITVMFHKLTGNRCRLSSALEEENQPALVATYKSNGGTRFLYEEGEAITSRSACNEKEILSRTTLAEREASFELPMEGATFVEIVVAAYKALLQKLYPDLGRKLIFARMNLGAVPAGGPCSVRHRRSSGDFFEAQLFRGDVRVGTLIFGVK